MRKLWRFFKRILVRPSEDSRATRKGESFEEWLARTGQKPSESQIGYLTKRGRDPYEFLRLWYWQDYIGRGYGTQEETEAYDKKQGWSR